MPQSSNRKRSYFLISATIIIGLVLLSFVLFSVFKSSKAAILVESVPEAVVIINGERKGKTPYEEELLPGEITLELVPESFDIPLSPYKTNVKLTSGVKTIVRRKFGGEGGGSSGEIISFDKSLSSETNLAIISTPDGVDVSLDNDPKGVTPLKLTSITPSNHQISITTRGYYDRTFSVRAVSGYTVTVIVDLEKNNSLDISKDTEKEPDKKEIAILKTPTGFLRARAKASIDSEEVGRVIPGEIFPLLNTSEDDKWLEIELSASVSGWISSEYATMSAKAKNEED